jgi:hypothetical protein
MSQSYRAILTGNRLDWIDPPPALQGPTLVEITILHPETEEERRQFAVDALTELAEAGGIKSIPDPAAWQREIRRDRPLPGREE